MNGFLIIMLYLQGIVTGANATYLVCTSKYIKKLHDLKNGWQSMSDGWKSLSLEILDAYDPKQAKIAREKLNEMERLSGTTE